MAPDSSSLVDRSVAARVADWPARGQRLPCYSAFLSVKDNGDGSRAFGQFILE